MSMIAWWVLLALGAVVGAPFVGAELFPGPRPALDVYLSSLPMAPFFLIAAFTFWRRPLHPVARRLLALAACPMIALGLGEILSVLWLAGGPKPWYWLIAVAGQVADLGGVAGGIALAAVFPDGLHRRRYERWIVFAVVAQVVALPALLLLSTPTLAYDPFMVWARPMIPSPIYVPGLVWLGHVAADFYYSVFLWAVVGVGLFVSRYRRVPRELKVLFKWPLLSAICFAGTVVLGTLNHYGIVPYWLSQGAWDITLPLWPLSIAVALFRYRLLDIEVVIRRSLVYGVLWLGISGAYFGVAWALGLAAGQRLPIAAAILLTIVATVVFQPARHWLEGLADHWVFGERLSGYQAVRQLGATLETTVDVAALGPRLATTIRSALGLRWVRVSSRRSRGESILLEPIGWDGIAPTAIAAAASVVPLAHAGELVGVIECGPKLEGRLDERDQDLLAALGRQAALALRNARLAADLTDQLELVNVQAHELAESRARIVQAQDAERRRMQRDLHDGVQQHLVTLAAKLRQATVLRTPDVQRVVHDLASEAEDAVFALQDFSNGIYPSVLSDEGLPAALWSQAQRLPVTVELDIAASVVGRRFDRESEAALYFVAVEAIVNAHKHASADRIRVILRQAGKELWLEVVDDGRGMPSYGEPRGLGLANMKDRMAALDGSLEIESRPGEGTRVIARVPDGLAVRAPEGTPVNRSALPTPAD
jgi:signal transduction histidine kinase